MVLYHYYDKSGALFRNLSELPIDEAKAVLEKIKSEKPDSQSAQRNDKYPQYRRNCEEIVRREFTKKGGKILRTPPHYMVVRHSPWLSAWFENCGIVKISADEFDTDTLSFTYGDSMPTFSEAVNDGKEYRHKVYTYDEIPKIIEKYGLPQDWNDDGKFGPERYIEVQVWSDGPVSRYKKEKICPVEL